MAIRLSGAELARAKADFDAPKKKGGKGNPNGRPPSPRPRTATLTFRLTEAEKEKLEEAARLIGETKTGVIVEGIDLVYSKAIAAEKKRQQKNEKQFEGMAYNPYRKDQNTITVKIKEGVERE